MRRRFPLIALWAPLAFLLVTTAVTGKLCLEQLLAMSAGASTATGALEFISPAWVIQQVNLATSKLWGLSAATGTGIILIAASSVWVSLSCGTANLGQSGPPA